MAKRLTEKPEPENGIVENFEDGLNVRRYYLNGELVELRAYVCGAWLTPSEAIKLAPWLPPAER